MGAYPWEFKGSYGRGKARIRRFRRATSTRSRTEELRIWIWAVLRIRRLCLVSADVKSFHYDTNYIFNEVDSDAGVRRAQFGQTLSVSHGVGKRFGVSGELWDFTQPFLRSYAFGNLWAAELQREKEPGVRRRIRSRVEQYVDSMGDSGGIYLFVAAETDAVDGLRLQASNKLESIEAFGGILVESQSC